MSARPGLCGAPGNWSLPRSSIEEDFVGFSEGLVLVAAPARAGAALQKRPVLSVGIRGAGAQSASGYRQSSGARESIESWRR
jgi:hypothetical protein